MIATLIRARYVAFAAVVAGLAALVALGRHVTYEQSLQSFFAPDDPAVLDYQKAARRFGSDNVVFVAYDDPALLSPAGMGRVAELAAALGPARVESVLRVESLDSMPLLWQIDDRLLDLDRLKGFTRRGVLAALKMSIAALGQAGSPLTVRGALRSADAKARAELARRITNHPLMRGTLVSADGRTTAVVVRLKGMAEQDPKATVAALREAADGFAKKHNLPRPALVGPPVLLADGFAAIEVDGQRLAVVGMALIGLVTLSATHSLWWAIVPILAGWTVWRAAETAMAVLGLKLSLSGGPLVAQIIVLTMPAASHLAIHFRDDLRREPRRRAAAVATLGAVTAPVLWCALTGALGYGALMTSNVVPVLQFGGILAGCTLVAAVLTLAISPVAMLPPVRLEIPIRAGSTSRVGGGMDRMTGWVLRHPAAIVVGVLAVVVPLAAGMGRLAFESNYINAFQPDTRVVRDYRFAESRLGGIGVVSLVVPAGTAIDPPALARFRALDKDLAALRRGDAPALAQVLSPATVLDPDGRLAALTEDQARRLLETKLELIDASPQADLLNGFWDRRGGWARVVVRVVEQQEAAEKEAIFRRAEALARGAFGPEAFVTGLSYLLTQTTRGIMATSWQTFLWSAASILAMLTLAFRGPRLAVLAILPTLLSVALVLGLMGWLGMRLDIATALVASVALGLSVDDTFHTLLQYRRLRAEAPFDEALRASSAVTGPGVLLSSLAVGLGFAVLRFSEFVPFSNFGAMVGIATLGSSLGNLVLLPACLALGHRWARGPAGTVPAAGRVGERGDVAGPRSAR